MTDDVVANVIARVGESMRHIHTVEPDGTADADVLTLLGNEHGLGDLVIDGEEDSELKVFGDYWYDASIGIEVGGEELG
jgi:hypothetical protein